MSAGSVDQQNWQVIFYFIWYFIYVWLCCSLVIIFLVWTYGTWWVPPVIQMIHSNCLVYENKLYKWSCHALSNKTFSLHLKTFFSKLFFSSKHGCKCLDTKKEHLMPPKIKKKKCLQSRRFNEALQRCHCVHTYWWVGRCYPNTMHNNDPKLMLGWLLNRYVCSRNNNPPWTSEEINENKFLSICSYSASLSLLLPSLFGSPWQLLVPCSSGLFPGLAHTTLNNCLIRRHHFYKE